jgi:hypothetical protein
VFLHPLRSAGHGVHFSAFGAQNIDTLFFILGWARCVSTKSMLGHVTSNLYFCIGRICGSCGAFRCILGVKRRCAIFHARVGPVQFQEKAHWGTLRRTCVFHQVGSTGHVVHSGASVAPNVNALFFMLRWTWCGFHKSMSGHVSPNLYFCIQWNLRVRNQVVFGLICDD